MMTKHHLSFFSLTLAGVAFCASSCSLDTNGVVDPNQIGGFGGSSSSSSSSSSGDSSSSSSSGSATGGAGGMAGSGGSGGTAGVGGSGGAGGAPCPGTQELCDGMCYDTSSDTAHCGNCTTTCSPDQTCMAGVCQLCAPGTVQACYNGTPGTAGVGQCVAGTETCAADGLSWEPCVGEVLPGTEVCMNGIDEDCDGSDLTGSVCLVNTGLVARYFLDEADMGKGPTMAMDSAPNPLNLPITYDPGSNQLAWYSRPTGRALQWAASDGLGVAMSPIDGNKIKMMLEGQQRITLEFVAEVDTVSATQHNRIFTIGAGTTNLMSLGMYSTPRYTIQAIGGSASFATTFGAARAVLHVVIDTTQATGANRVRFYVNGAVQTPTGGTPPQQNAGAALGTGNLMCLGNRNTQGRSYDGELYYAAVYAGALSTTDIATNTAILTASDDE